MSMCVLGPKSEHMTAWGFFNGQEVEKGEEHSVVCCCHSHSVTGNRAEMWGHVPHYLLPAHITQKLMLICSEKNIRPAAFLVCKCCGVVLIDRNWLWSLFNVRTFSPRVLLDANNVLDLQLQETCFGKSIIWLPHIFLWPCLSWDEAV